MKTAANIGLGALLAAAVAVIAIAAFIGSGVYDIGADDHHTRLISALIEMLRERSISVRAGAIEVPSLEDPAKISSGARGYATFCVGCHLAPGVTKSVVRPGLYPHAPNLAQQALPDARRTFWTIKHGIKMSAMPAWGKSLDDAAIWEIAAFVRELPTMSPEAYEKLSTVPGCAAAGSTVRGK
jgi:mono/diheme cytochrome c family protein